MNFHIDAGVAYLSVGVLVFLSQLIQFFLLSRVHTLVNSNFSEAKAARLAAEAALETSQRLNHSLRAQLSQAAAAAASTIPATEATLQRIEQQGKE